VLNDFLESPKLKVLSESLQKGDSILIEQLWNSPKAIIASIAQQATGKNILILTGASLEETRLYHDLRFFTNHAVVDYPAWETLPNENIPPSPDIVGERYQILHDLTSNREPRIVLSNLQACLQKVIPSEKFEQLFLKLKIGTTIAFDKLIRQFDEMGYQRRSVASDKGEYAVRGGIIDIFPVACPDPYRLEFWDDEIESIRIFDPIGQKSVKPVDQVAITPAQELELAKKTENLSTILDYLGPETIVIFDDLLTLEDRYATLVNISGPSSHSFGSIESFLDQVAPLQKLFWSQTPIDELSELKVLTKTAQNYYSDQAPLIRVAFNMFNRELIAERWQHPFVTISEYLFPHSDYEVTGLEITQALGKLTHTDLKLHILASTELEETNFKQRLADASISPPQKTYYHQGYLSNGFVCVDAHEMILPLTEINHRYKIRRQKQRSTYHTVPSEVFDLAPGETIVHLNHGIGKYLGLEKRPNNLGILNEFFIIEYADNAKLYVPINQSYLISKYVGASEELPKMHTLGGTRWKKTREQTEKAIIGYASELLTLYAQRELKGGYIYPPDSAEMQAFEEDFPYSETEDQLSAIASIKQDMLSNKAMDRLICGDVGYGKTEVAMRAAFKAVIDGQKQVAVLVPTTILAMQHYENFRDRVNNFPVNVGVVSRFRTAKQIKETLEGVANGSIDILVGTHRIISEDVRFKDLGLIIIDEEQRFGVKAKEHLKKVKTVVDCLTMSATPIPRTLYMSLIGARDMSVISTPPQDRLPITTLIAQSHDQVFKSALLRELARDGQAYVIHNRVETIFDMADRLKKLLPQARIVVAHGQMHADEIDTVFHAFKSGQADILVATTIIESGIDIPNANTILIDRADRFGLGDLYQMRGRVGRWNRRAYAYFLVPNIQTLPEISRKRLNALVESSGYGGGMKIAMRDLEIRGAGDILGLEQSGHVAEIGFHLYCKLLKRTVLTLQRKIPSVIVDTKMEFALDARIPEDYIDVVSLRMEIYQRLGEAIDQETVDLIWEEIKDRFGPPPLPAVMLYYLMRIRVFAARNGFSSLKIEKLTFTAEQHKGKLATSKKILLGKWTEPQDLEKKIIAGLKKEFSLL